MQQAEPLDPPSKAKATLWGRLRAWLPALVLLLAILVAYLSGAGSLLSLMTLAENRAMLTAFVREHLAAAMLFYFLAYILVVALSLPGAALMSITGGFLFGVALGAPLTVLSATAGATVVFAVVKTSLGATIAEKAGPLARKLSEGFARDAFNYLLFLRLVPAFPFFLVNAVAGICGVKLSTFVIATLLGIIPGSLAFTYLGTGLDSIIDAQLKSQQDCIAANGAANCKLELNVGALITPQIVIAFVILGLVALLPVVLKYFKNRRSAS